MGYEILSFDEWLEATRCILSREVDYDMNDYRRYVDNANVGDCPTSKTIKGLRLEGLNVGCQADRGCTHCWRECIQYWAENVRINDFWCL